MELRKTILYPQKTGKLTIEPLTLSIGVEVPTNRRDIFGRRLYETVDKTYSAKTQTINVKPLPDEDKPASFTGAVGRFDFDVTVDRNKLQAMESLQAEVKLSGQGNMSLFELPPLVAHKTPKFLNQKSKTIFAPTPKACMAQKRIRLYFSPQQAGKQVIPSMEFSYFDPDTKKYVTKTSTEISLEVDPNTSITSSNANVNNSSNNINFINTPDSQFNFIKLKTELKPTYQERFFKSTAFWAISLSALALFPFFLVFAKIKNRDGLSETDKNLKKANKLAKKYLSEAKSHLNDSKTFYLS